ncbi:NPP1 family protein [Streptomyces sp. NPDC088910]|uniref:NPP1 family protein n=1 Tax=Streptomyces sp. NPDC088910 TaxID=3365911 RepID=UPI0038051ACB
MFAAIAFILALSAPAQANVINKMPQNADGTEQAFSPAYDYDGDGCYATAAISSDGYVNPGLKPGGATNGHCHDYGQLDQSNTYSRKWCNHGWCAIMYASYFEKDQVSACVSGACAGHRHDFEHVIVWVQNNRIQYVSVSQHKGWETHDRSQVRFDPGGHPKVVYHKDGGSTHCFRFANSGDDAVENVTGNWFFPRLVGWNGYPSVAFRNKFIYHTSFGSATIKLGTGTFGDQLNQARGNRYIPLDLQGA